jgi:hypothetical protein
MYLWRSTGKEEPKGQIISEAAGPSSISFTKGLNLQELLYFLLNFD